jgi:N-acetylglucosamine kinase-like BadF-type ATPase
LPRLPVEAGESACPTLYLGVDGGQSSTTALIADETGCILGRGRGGPCNHVTTAEGRAKFLSAIGDCLQQACREAKIEAATVEFAAVCLGLSGGGEDKEAYTRELIRSERYKITHDAEIALTGATAGEPGIIIIAGTGSMAFGRNSRGEKARAGGWGYVFGDEGGAFDLTRRALRASLQYEEGWGEETALHRLLLEATGATTANELLHQFYGGLDRSYIATLATIVTQAADNGDSVAGTILRDAAEKLAWYVAGVYKRLFAAAETVPVAYVGGVFKSERFRGEFSRCVTASIACKAIAPRFSPAAGALLEALRLDGNQSPLSGLAEVPQ